MSDRLILVGGPLDGASIAGGPRPPFIYCAETRPQDGAYRAKAFSAPGKDRHLYRELDGETRFIYAGHTHRQCEGCEGFPSDRGRCPFCGHAPAAH